MKYIKRFNDEASYQLWKESDKFIKPSLSDVKTRDGELNYHYTPKFRATYNLHGDENEVIMKCGNIFNSLKVNGNNIECEEVKMDRVEVKSGNFGTLTDIEIIVNPEDCVLDEDLGVVISDKSKYLSHIPPYLRIQILDDVPEGEEIYGVWMVHDFARLGGAMIIPITSLTCIDEVNHIYELLPYISESTTNYLPMGLARAYGSLVTFVGATNNGTLLRTKITCTDMVGEVVDNSIVISSSDFSINEEGYTVINDIEKTVDVWNHEGSYIFTHDSDIENVAIGMHRYSNSVMETNLIMPEELEAYIGYGMAARIDEKTIDFGNYFRFIQQNVPQEQVEGMRVCVFFVDATDITEGGIGFTDIDKIIPTTVVSRKEVFDSYPRFEVSSASELSDVYLNPVYDLNYDKGVWVSLKGYNETTNTHITYYLTKDDLTYNDTHGWKFSSNAVNECGNILAQVSSVEIIVNDVHIMFSSMDDEEVWGEDGASMYFHADIPTNISTIGITGGAPKEIVLSGVEGNVSVIGEISPMINYIPSEGFKETHIESVILPEGIEIVESGAFANCEEMHMAYLPSTIKKLGNEAFCDSIHPSTCINLDLVQDMGENVFKKDNTLTNYVKMTLNITDITKATPLWCDVDAEWYVWTKPFDSSQLAKLIVDGEEVVIQQLYQFTSTGEHEVIYVFKKQDISLQGLATYVHDINNWYVLDAIQTIEINLISPVTSMFCFASCSEKLTEVNIKSIDTSKCTTLRYAFMMCSALTSLDLSMLDTSNVTNMSGVFYICSTLNDLNVSTWDTFKVTSMENMFEGCSSLTTVDLSSFDTSNVTNMDWMFRSCDNLSMIKFGIKANISSLTDYEYMFEYLPENGTIYIPDTYSSLWVNVLVTNRSTSKFPTGWNIYTVVS